MHWETEKYVTLYCDIHFIAVVWKQTRNVSEVCLYVLQNS